VSSWVPHSVFEEYRLTNFFLSSMPSFTIPS
jgi:hypothetical protein